MLRPHLFLPGQFRTRRNRLCVVEWHEHNCKQRLENCLDKYKLRISYLIHADVCGFWSLYWSGKKEKRQRENRIVFVPPKQLFMCVKREWKKIEWTTLFLLLFIYFRIVRFQLGSWWGFCQFALARCLWHPEASEPHFRGCAWNHGLQMLPRNSSRASVSWVFFLTP